MVDEDDTRHFIAWASRVLAHFKIGEKLPQLVAAYTEAWREYHTVRHVNSMAYELFNLPESVIPQGESRFIVGAIILYHDVWLKLGRARGENERKSAELAAAHLGDTSSPNVVKGIYQGIIATITHDLTEVDVEYHELVSLLLDLDLMGLAKSPEAFKADTEALAIESQPLLTSEEYYAGAAMWASAFLDRGVIYHTAHFAPCEEQARANLVRLAGL